jgi:hypothetical protein
VPVGVEHVEEHVDDGRGAVAASLHGAERRPAVLVERDELAVEHRGVRAHRVTEPAHLRELGGDVAQVSRLQLQPSALHEAERPVTVPLHLVRPLVVVRRRRQRRRRRRLHRRDRPDLGERLSRRILRRVHAPDHPVLAVGLEQDVAALHALAVEDELHLTVGPLLALVRALVPDGDLPAAVLAIRDLTREVEVRQRVVLGLHGEVVHPLLRRDALRHRPRRADAVALEAQVPVQPTGVVLLDDEARQSVRRRRRRVDVGRRLARDVEVTLSPVLVELLLRHLRESFSLLQGRMSPCGGRSGADRSASGS